jgi:hypothetical protein
VNPRAVSPAFIYVFLIYKPIYSMKSKISFLAALLAAALFMTACNKDATLEGEWEITRIVQSQCPTPEENQTVDYTNGCRNFVRFPAINVEECYKITFTVGTYDIERTEKVGGNTQAGREFGNYTMDGNNVTMCNIDASKGCYSATVNRNRTELTITRSIGGCNQTISYKKK